VGFTAFLVCPSCCQAAHPFPATLPTPRRIPLVHSRTVSPRPLPSWRLHTALFAPPGLALPHPPFCALPAVSSPSRLCSADESVPPCAVAVVRWPTLPWAFLSPSRSFARDTTGLRRCLAMNGRSASAAPCPFRSGLLLQARPPRPYPTFDTVRHRDREYASLRCPPRRRDPARSRADEHSKRRTRGASRASRTSRFITDAGQPVHPLQGARRVDVTIAFDRLERRRSDCPKAVVPRTPRLIAVCREPRGSAGWQHGG